MPLAQTLFDSDDFELASQVYQEILRGDPNNQVARIGTASVFESQYMPQQAKGVLESFTPTTANRRLYMLTWAEYHEIEGWGHDMPLQAIPLVHGFILPFVERVEASRRAARAAAE